MPKNQVVLDNLFKLLEQQTHDPQDPHQQFPTSDRLSYGQVHCYENEIKASAILKTHTTVKIQRHILDVSCAELNDIYRSVGRCLLLIDQAIYSLYKPAIESYFRYHQIPLIVLPFRCLEEDKSIASVEKILVQFKKHGVARNEPILIMGGGVISDIGGLACALYHRYIPYIMLCTSVVSGIDAGPSPRVCCDAQGYKNLYGAYQAPTITITDVSFYKTLTPGHLRHGLAEIIKMAIVKDAVLFDLIKHHGAEILRTKFATVDRTDDAPFLALCDRIILLALYRYTEAEYGNLYETHQMRPHAYGHTWSPGFELPAGLLHGHAVSIGMGYGAYLSWLNDWISEEDCYAVFQMCESIDLALYHTILENATCMWTAQTKMMQKRGGHLCAPLPKERIGGVGYLEQLSKKELLLSLRDYRKKVLTLPKQGRGKTMFLSDYPAV